MENNCGIWTGQLIAGYYIRDMSYNFIAKTNSEQRAWRSICSNSVGDRLAAVDYGGNIYTSSDYGVTWTPRENARNWRSICSNSLGDRVAAVLNNSNIYISSDYGVTWLPRELAREWRFICSNSLGDQLAAVVNNGNIYTSSNYGVTWTPRDLARSWKSICSSSVGDRLAAVDYGGNIYTSSNYGVTWTPRDLARSWQSICSNSVGDRLAAVVYGGPDGRIYTSSNYGESWTPRESARKWGSICSNAVGDRLAVIEALYDLGGYNSKTGGFIYTSHDYGNTWVQRTISRRDWTSICSNSAGDKFAAVVETGSSFIYTASVYYTYKGTILEDMLATGTSTTLTGYQINGTALKFLKAFYKDTDKNAVTDLRANMDMFKIAGSNPEICPAYILHADTGTGFPIPSDITKMFVVCIGGGGGGGGGGVRTDGGTRGGSGGGGGGGALNGWFVTYNSSYTTYNVTIGEGGLYGPPNNRTRAQVSEGAESTSAAKTSGQNGLSGGNTTFTYAGSNYESVGGTYGKGGLGDGYVAGYVPTGGTGGASTTTPYGNSGGNGGNGNNDYQTDAVHGGIGGESGNRRGTSQRFLINKSYINVEPFEPFTATTDYPDASGGTYNDDRICYGEGGRGGRGETSATANYAWAGYSGLKGCVIVFFYY